MLLEEKMRLYKTINRGEEGRCKGCGNPWWFEGPTWWECTTCGKMEDQPKQEEPE